MLDNEILKKALLGIWAHIQVQVSGVEVEKSVLVVDVSGTVAESSMLFADVVLSSGVVDGLELSVFAAVCSVLTMWPEGLADSTREHSHKLSIACLRIASRKCLARPSAWRQRVSVFNVFRPFWYISQLVELVDGVGLGARGSVVVVVGAVVITSTAGVVVESPLMVDCSVVDGIEAVAFPNVVVNVVSVIGVSLEVQKRENCKAGWLSRLL